MLHSCLSLFLLSFLLVLSQDPSSPTTSNEHSHLTFDKLQTNFTLTDRELWEHIHSLSWENCPPRVFITMATNDKVVQSIMALSEGLRFVHSKYPLVVLIGQGVSWVAAEKLRLLGVLLIPFEPIPLPSTVKLLMPHWREAMNKLHIWSLVQFEKIIWLDSDQVILRNFDLLFEEKPLGVIHDYEYFPSCNLRGDAMNSALMVLEPDLKTYTELLEYLNSDPSGSGNSFVYGDQELIETFFKKRDLLHFMDKDWDMFTWRCQCENFNLSALHVVHFVSSLLPTDQLIAEPLREVLPNRNEPTFFQSQDQMERRTGCDAIFYERWKYMYHRAQTRLSLLQRQANRVMKRINKSKDL